MLIGHVLAAYDHIFTMSDDGQQLVGSCLQTPTDRYTLFKVFIQGSLPWNVERLLWLGKQDTASPFHSVGLGVMGIIVSMLRADELDH